MIKVRNKVLYLYTHVYAILIYSYYSKNIIGAATQITTSITLATTTKITSNKVDNKTCCLCLDNKILSDLLNKHN